jgi:exosome complex component RRP45
MNVDEASPPTAFLDPDTLETQLAIGTLSVALNAQRELCVVHKGSISITCVMIHHSYYSYSAGGLPLTPSQMMHLIGIACAIVKDVDARVAKALGEDWETRKSIVEVR